MKSRFSRFSRSQTGRDYINEKGKKSDDKISGKRKGSSSNDGVPVLRQINGGFIEELRVQIDDQLRDVKGSLDLGLVWSDKTMFLNLSDESYSKSNIFD